MSKQPDVMSIVIGVSDDLERMTLALVQNGIQLGWIEFNNEQCEHLIKNIKKYSSLLKAPT